MEEATEGGREGGGGERCFSFPREARVLMEAVSPDPSSERNNGKRRGRTCFQPFAFSAPGSRANWALGSVPWERPRPAAPLSAPLSSSAGMEGTGHTRVGRVAVGRCCGVTQTLSPLPSLSCSIRVSVHCPVCFCFPTAIQGRGDTGVDGSVEYETQTQRGWCGQTLGAAESSFRDQGPHTTQPDRAGWKNNAQIGRLFRRTSVQLQVNKYKLILNHYRIHRSFSSS